MTPALPPDPPAIVVHAPAPIDLMRLALCIEHKENGSWDKPGGKACWTRDAWFEVCPLAYSWAQDRWMSRCVMIVRLRWLSHRLESKGWVTPSPYLLAVAWNKGFDRAMQPFNSAYPYGTEVGNLYFDPTFKVEPTPPLNR